MPAAPLRRPASRPPASTLPRRAARASLAVLVGSALLAPAGGAAGRADFPVIELPAPACDVCAPGQPPPPAAVQDQLRRLNADANWRRQPTTGDTIPLGSATRIWLQRAWASGRLQPGVANVGGARAGGGVAAMRSGVRQQPRASLADRSRARLADRRSTRDRSRSARSGAEAGRTPSTGAFGTGSQLGTNRSASSFGNLGGGLPEGMGR